MGTRFRTSTREIGTALAVLAIYVLTLLLPLHQATAQQRDLDALGYETASNWSVCAQLAADDQGVPAEATALKCPAVGAGKPPIAAVLPVLALPVRSLAVVDVSHRAAPVSSRHLSPDHVGQSRAPPVSV